MAVYNNCDRSCCFGCCGPVGPQGPAGPQGVPGAAGATATNQNALLSNSAAQAVAAGDALALPTNQINSTGDIAAAGTNGLTLQPGQYLVSFGADSADTAAGDLGAALALDGTALTDARSAVPTTAADSTRIALNTVLTLTAPSTLTVINDTGNALTYTNASLTAVKLA